MSRNYYSEINLHIVWHTAESALFLTESIEPLTYRILRKRILEFDGICLHAVQRCANSILLIAIIRGITTNTVMDRTAFWNLIERTRRKSGGYPKRTRELYARRIWLLTFTL